MAPGRFPAALLILGAFLLAATAADGRQLLDKERTPKRVYSQELSVIMTFNRLGQQAVRDTGAGLQLAAKWFALLHKAQKQAIARAPAENQVAAAAFAGRAVLGRLFPLLTSEFDTVMPRFTAGLTGSERTKVVRIATDIAQELVQDSLGDGCADWASWYTPPTGDEPPGVYRFTPGQTFSLLPQLARATPLVIPSAEEFDQGGPHPLGSPAYKRELAEVREIGAAQGANRTTRDTETAFWWFDGIGTSSAAGKWTTIAANLLADKVPATVSIFETADLFYRLNAAMFDASVVCWAAKYKYNSWRPITAIRNGGDADWEPLMATPFHPEHPSGHSCVGGAAGAIITSFMGTDALTFTSASEYPHYSAPTLGPRTYTSIAEAVQEGKDSRVWAGVHFRRAVDVGEAIGLAVAKYVWARG